MARALGVFHELHRHADFLWNQCEGALGSDGDLVVRSGDRGADLALVMNWPVPPEGRAEEVRVQAGATVHHASAGAARVRVAGASARVDRGAHLRAAGVGE